MDAIAQITPLHPAVIPIAAPVVEPASPLLYWADETRQAAWETGVHRVAHRLGNALVTQNVEVVSVGWDWHERRMTTQSNGLVPSEPIEPLLRSTTSTPWLLIPELPMGLAIHNLDAAQIGRAYGLRTAAILHDLSPLTHGDLYDPSFVAAFRRYARMFASVDAVLTTSWHGRRELETYCAKEGIRPPDIIVAPLPAQFAGLPRVRLAKPVRRAKETLELLTVSPWEPRTNLPRLLRAFQAAQRVTKVSMQLTLIGHRGAHPDLDAEMRALIAETPGVVDRGSCNDRDVAAAYAAAHASIYPSYAEGFGLPVMESLWLATPCLCHTGSAMAETATGGGVVSVDMTDETVLTDALLGLARNGGRVRRLSADAVARPLATWADYARGVIGTLRSAD